MLNICEMQYEMQICGTENVAVSAADTVQRFSKDRFRRSVRPPLHSTAPRSQTFIRSLVSMSLALPVSGL